MAKYFLLPNAHNNPLRWTELVPQFCKRNKFEEIRQVESIITMGLGFEPILFDAKSCIFNKSEPILPSLESSGRPHKQTKPKTN